MRFTSFVLSLLIHVLVLALGLYFPFYGEGLTIDLDRPVYEVELVKMPQSKPAPEPEKSKPVPKQPQQASKPSPKKTPPKPKSKPTRLAAKAPKKQQAPKPTQIARQTKKPSQPAPAKKKSVPKPTEKKKPSQPEKSKPPPPTKEEVLSRALGDIEKGMGQEEDAEQVVARELASLKQELSRQQPSGSSGRGKFHIGELYGRIVEQKIKENWRYPQLGQGSNLSAEAKIQVDSSGEIAQFSLQRQSGRSDFDSSVLRAIEETGKLPPPPSKEIRTITITFNLQEQAG